VPTLPLEAMSLFGPWTQMRVHTLASELVDSTTLAPDGFVVPPAAMTSFWHSVARAVNDGVPEELTVSSEELCAAVQNELEVLDITCINDTLYLSDMACAERFAPGDRTQVPAAANARV
jgi:hypothetical protein